MTTNGTEKYAKIPLGIFTAPPRARSSLKESRGTKIPLKKRSNFGAEMDTLLPEYLPPCFWSCAAFSPKSHKAVHAHPFQKYEENKKIEEKLGPYSCFSWPFRLSFVHSKDQKKAMGNYQKDLPQRIDRFTSKFEPQESIVFFYLNYDNPISGDEEKYALVGCAVGKLKTTHSSRL